MGCRQSSLACQSVVDKAKAQPPHAKNDDELLSMTSASSSCSSGGKWDGPMTKEVKAWMEEEAAVSAGKENRRHGLGTAWRSTFHCSIPFSSSIWSKMREDERENKHMCTTLTELLFQCLKCKPPRQDEREKLAKLTRLLENLNPDSRAKAREILARFEEEEGPNYEKDLRENPDKLAELKEIIARIEEEGKRGRSSPEYPSEETRGQRETASKSKSDPPVDETPDAKLTQNESKQSDAFTPLQAMAQASAKEQQFEEVKQEFSSPSLQSMNKFVEGVKIEKSEVHPIADEERKEDSAASTGPQTPLPALPVASAKEHSCEEEKPETSSPSLTNEFVEDVKIAKSEVRPIANEERKGDSGSLTGSQTPVAALPGASAKDQSCEEENEDSKIAKSEVRPIADEERTEDSAASAASTRSQTPLPALSGASAKEHSCCEEEKQETSSPSLQSMNEFVHALEDGMIPETEPHPIADEEGKEDSEASTGSSMPPLSEFTASPTVSTTGSGSASGPGSASGSDATGGSGTMREHDSEAGSPAGLVSKSASAEDSDSS